MASLETLAVVEEVSHGGGKREKREKHEKCMKNKVLFKPNGKE